MIFLRYFHYELQCTVREMEGGIYEKMSTYLGTLARCLPNSNVVLDNVLHGSSFSRTELLTCSALQNSYNNIRQQAERITRSVIFFITACTGVDHHQPKSSSPLFPKPKHYHQHQHQLHREYNYRCYLKSYTCLGDHVQ